MSRDSGFIVLTAMLIIGALEAINMIVLKQNGYVLAGVFGALTGLAGYGGYKAGRKAQQDVSHKDSI